VNSFKWIAVKRTALERSGPKRLSVLRNLALEMVDTYWCSYLDDDNELEPTHFRTLVHCAMRTASPAAHSWRSLWLRDGTPFCLRERHPWCRDPALSTKLFNQYVEAGIYQVGSNVVQDQVVPHRRSESMVDMSEWLFVTDFIRRLGFVNEYCAEDWQTSRAEDSKLLDAIVATGLRIPSTQQCTLRYYMGGYSNDWSNAAAQIEGWCRE
jgi:hypothetical protein